MRSLRRAAVDDVDSLSARAKANRVFVQADQAQDLLDDGGLDTLVSQALSGCEELSEVLVVFIRLVAKTRAAKTAAPVKIPEHL